MKGRSHRLVSTEPPDDWVNGSWTVDCACGVNFDDGEEMVNCDECGVWVHTRCSRFIKGEASFACDKCKSKKNRNDNEETEVAQLLVELTTKTMRMDNLCRPTAPPRPAFRLWKDVPIEEKVHVQGVPGGDPALFQGLSSVFTSELWKCTGYVPKKFNFQYREFPCWDEKEEGDGTRAEDETENPVDRGADVLFSLSKEIVTAKPTGVEVSVRGTADDAYCERKSSSKEKKREGKDSSVRIVKNDMKKERNNILTHAVHLSKQKEEHTRSKERNGKKKSRSADKEADSKRRVSTASIVEEKLEFHDDMGFKAAVKDSKDKKDERKMQAKVQERDDGCIDVPIKGDKSNDDFLAKVPADKCFPEEASRHSIPTDTMAKSEKVNAIPQVAPRCEGSPKSGSAARLLVESNHDGGTLAKKEDLNLAVDGLKHLKDEKHDPKVLNGTATSVTVDSQKLNPPVKDLHCALTEIQVKHMPQDKAAGVSPSSIQHNATVKTEVDNEQPRGNLDLLSSLSSVKLDSPSDMDLGSVRSATTPKHDPATSSLQRNEHGAGDLTDHCCGSETVKQKYSASESPQHGQELECAAEQLLAQKVPLNPKLEPKYTEEPSINGGSSPSRQAPSSQRKIVVGTGKSPTSSSVMISKTSVSCSSRISGTSNSPMPPRSINLSKQRVKTNLPADSKKDHATDTVRGDTKQEALGKSTKEHTKSYASSGLKASQMSRISHASTVKRTMSEPKEQVHHPSSKASMTHSAAVSTESASSLHSQNPSNGQSKTTATAPSQKGERYNQSSSQTSSKANHSSSMHPPPAPVNSSPTLSDEELALLLHQELNSSPRVPRVPRVRNAGSVPQLGSSTTTSLLIKRSSSSGAKDHISVSRRKKEDASRDGSRNASEHIDETKKKDRSSSSCPDQRRQDPNGTPECSTKDEACNGSSDVLASSKKNVHLASTNTSVGGPSSSAEANDQSFSSIRSSPRDTSDDDVGAAVGSTPRTLPGLLDEIMRKGKRMTYEELCNAVLPHWHNLRKHNGERYAYSSHSQAVLDCLRNRNEWAQLVDRGPKTNAGRKKRKFDSDPAALDCVDSEFDTGNLKEVEVKYVDSQREDFPKGKRKARKRRRLALQGRGIKDVRKRRKADADMDDDLGPFSPSSEEGAESIFSEDESQASSSSDDSGSTQ